MSNIYETDTRFMRYEVNPMRGNRYAIYEKKEGRPDALIFFSSNEASARIAWDRIKDLPVQKRVSTDSMWLYK